MTDRRLPSLSWPLPCLGNLDIQGDSPFVRLTSAFPPLTSPLKSPTSAVPASPWLQATLRWGPSLRQVLRPPRPAPGMGTPPPSPQLPTLPGPDGPRLLLFPPLLNLPPGWEGAGASRCCALGKTHFSAIPSLPALLTPLTQPSGLPSTFPSPGRKLLFLPPSHRTLPSRAQAAVTRGQADVPVSRDRPCPGDCPWPPRVSVCPWPGQRRPGGCSSALSPLRVHCPPPLLQVTKLVRRSLLSVS